MVRTAELLAAARLCGSAWPQETTAKCKADVESLLQSTGSSDNRSGPAALGVPDPYFDERGRGVMQVAMLCKALGLWQRIDTLEKWAREARRGDGPPTDKAPHFAAIAADYAPMDRALVFVTTLHLAADHPHFRRRWAGEEQAELAAAKARDAAGLGPSPEFVVPSDSDLGLRPGVAR